MVGRWWIMTRTWGEMVEKMVEKWLEMVENVYKHTHNSLNNLPNSLILPPKCSPKPADSNGAKKSHPSIC
jgi:hypothetical protein